MEAGHHKGARLDVSIDTFGVGHIGMVDDVHPGLDRGQDRPLRAYVPSNLFPPFVGRLDDISEPGMELIQEIAEVFGMDPEIDTQILAASIRHPRHMIEAAKAGADIATVPFSVLQQSMKHPLTEAGIERFLDDWRKREAVQIATAGTK